MNGYLKPKHKENVMAAKGKASGVLDSLKGYKTYIFGGFSIIGAAYGWYNGSVEPGAALNAIQLAIASMFLRSGIKSSTDGTAS
jgi:hypothetical protein